ncbi:unnamed protein product [Caenorhabditis angaria]|uniref:CYtochrome P450 family n=1 Tax=Caenorhabditis angaria TaxID=860376 RepID=A0A9P1IV70_9PELO|nr:unnamed protein product [Caenorhabditis angaria]
MIIVIAFSLIFLYFFDHFYWKRRNFPPGPTPWPLVGNFASVFLPPPGYLAFEKWTKKYGKVFTFWVAGTPYICITSYEKLKETFIKDGDIYVAKKPQQFQEEFRGGNFGVIETNGDIWKTHRRFALMNLRDFGLGKDLMQEKILIEVQDIFKNFDSTVGSGEEIDIPLRFYNGVANVINQATFGYRFEDGVKDKEFLRLKKLIDWQNDELGKPLIFLQFFVPALRKFIPGNQAANVLKKFKDDFYGFFNEQIKQHRKTIDFESEENGDYCEAYLKEQKKREAEGDFESFSDIQLSNMCLDLWFAGLLTTTTTISWALSFILHNPDVENKIYEELDKVIAEDRLITTSDKNDLPYMNAFITETQRCANIVPVNAFHQTTRDTVIDGWPVKAGTGVIAQISTVMMDEKVFPNPEKFDPTRHIDKETRKFKKIDEMIQFSTGKRHCLGEGLARMELFLFISNFLKRYKMRVKNLPSLDNNICLSFYVTIRSVSTAVDGCRGFKVRFFISSKSDSHLSYFAILIFVLFLETTNQERMDAALADTTNTMTVETTVPVENIKTTTTEETTPTTAETSTAATTELTSEEKATQLKNNFTSGKRLLLTSEFSKAADLSSLASQLAGKLFGDDSEQSFDPYFYYGQALWNSIT